MSLQIAAQGPAPKAPAKINYKKPQSGANKIYDLVCVGFGTAALGLAVALQDSADEGRKTATVLFLESKSQFQQEQHVSTTEHMETCFAQDLATTRNPMSKFTFLNYLHSQEKLKTFMGLFAESPYPVRADFEEYLAWCAGQVGNVVQYRQEVVAVTPVESNGFPVHLWMVTAVNGDGESRVVAARNVIMATGGEAQIVQHSSRGDTAGQDHPLEMLQVAEAAQELSKPVIKKTDVERFATVVTKSDQILNEVFYEEPFEMMRAML